MGIYIDDIEMPKGHEYLTINIWSNGITSYGLFNREGNLCTFKGVKAISVPSYGGRNMRKFLVLGGYEPFVIEAENWESAFWEAWNYLKEDIASITAIPADDNTSTDFWGEEYAEAKGLIEEDET